MTSLQIVRFLHSRLIDVNHLDRRRRPESMLVLSYGSTPFWSTCALMIS